MEDDDLITPERLAKGDLLAARNSRGRICVVAPKNLTIIKELVRKRLFPHHYEVYGLGFLELQNAFYAPLTTKSSAILLEQWGVGVSQNQASSLYLATIKMVGDQRISAVRYVLEKIERRKSTNSPPIDRRTPEDKLLAYWEKSFEKLIEVMDTEREKLFLINQLRTVK